MEKLTISFWILFMAASLQAQTTINSSGNSGTINGNNYSYSIGEMVLVNTASAGNLIVTQGVLYAPKNTVDVKSEELSHNEFKVFPNPTRDVINMQANLLENGNITIKLFDAQGRVLISKDWRIDTSHEEKQLNLQDFASGQYILHVIYSKDQKIQNQSYKIQKLN